MSTSNVCCLCGDIGFPDKLFRCNKCCNRLQHSYCSNYYDASTSVANVSCDWCLHEEKSTAGKKPVSSAKRLSSSSSGGGKDREHNSSSGEKVKQNDKDKGHRHHPESSDQKGKSSGSSPSPRTAARRYKLLKDVLC